MAGAATEGAVSVVIPTKDRAELLDQTLRSVHDQSARVAEVIVADDGSTDATPRVLERWGVTCVRNSEGGWGAANARNAGLSRVDTDLVAFVDSDDLLFPRAIESLRSQLLAEPRAPFAYGNALVAARAEGWRASGMILGPHEAECALSQACALYARNAVPSSGALVRTDAARAIGGYDSSLRFVEDHHFWVRLMTSGQPVHVPELVCVHRRHPGNRHNAALAASDLPALIRLADKNPALAPCVPARIGVQLCEESLQALKLRSPKRLLAAGKTLRGRGRAVPAILRASVRHFGVRRAGARAAATLWGSRSDIRDWLATY